MVRSILIIEDDSNVAPLEIALASLADVGICVFSDSRAALRFLEQDGPVIAGVITDLNLPHLDGFELVTAIRSNARSPVCRSLLSVAIQIPMCRSVLFNSAPMHSLPNPIHRPKFDKPLRGCSMFRHPSA